MFLETEGTGLMPAESISFAVPIGLHDVAEKDSGVFESEDAIPPIPSHTEQLTNASGHDGINWSQRRKRPHSCGLPSHTACTLRRSAGEHMRALIINLNDFITF